MSDTPTVSAAPAPAPQPVQTPSPLVNPLSPPTASGLTGLVEFFAGLPTGKAVVLSIVFTGCFLLATGKADRLIEIMGSAIGQGMREHTERVHETALSDAVIRHRQVGSVLSSVREDANSSRVVLFEFHNGSESLKGVPFLYQSATAESDGPGVASVRDTAQHVPLANTISWIPDFLAHKCIDQKIEDAEQGLKEDMQRVGTQRIVACPVFIPGTKEPSGYISAVFTKGWTVDDPAPVQARLRDASRIVGATLGAYLDSVGR